MKVTIKQIMDAVEGVQFLVAQPLNARRAFALSLLAQELDKTLMAYSTARLGALKRLGHLKKDSATEYEFDTDELRIEFEKQNEDLLAEVVKIRAPRIDFATLDDITIPARFLITLTPFFANLPAVEETPDDD